MSEEAAERLPDWLGGSVIRQPGKSSSTPEMSSEAWASQHNAAEAQLRGNIN
ncbi:hypothetical protein [Streptantibioticus ferralitis]|uniref:Uncharacterized protein n=1 Tax=Streptantibioticus ferralitis TaxID=236510 RepID=A0ABT5Z8B9_9ACTN|nr:hypothetical protein [Streptantibioticus ferralitis]MDF2260077.1 hypothetical protein [Streptantibioticus ferralitis]